ncbi:MAG: protein kinase [Deltaproteobacteria bacterium]|nr:protein kinase [Deltaproteobacteria bacterium]
MRERTPRIATDTSGLLLGQLAPGDRIGPFRVQGRLPSRGHGLVYVASHAKLQYRVMIRILPASYGSTSSIAMELIRAAQILESLDHPGIPRVIVCDTLPDGRSWVASQLIAGTKLGTVISEWPITAEDVVTVIHDVAAILETAHRVGLVHTNLVPSAIVMPDVEMASPLMVGDWGQARTEDSMSPGPFRLTSRGRPYLAPEQLQHETITTATDIYALGVIAYQAVTGELPMTPRAEAQDHIPAVVMTLIEQMLATDPARRPTSTQVRESAAQISTTLARIASGPEPTLATRTLADTISSERFTQVSGEINATSTTVVARIRLVRRAVPALAR